MKPLIMANNVSPRLQANQIVISKLWPYKIKYHNQAEIDLDLEACVSSPESLEVGNKGWGVKYQRTM